MTKIRTRINGQMWSVEIITEKQMKKDHGSYDGICLPDQKQIFIDEDAVNYTIIAHELFHAYFKDLHLADTNTVALNDLEEIMAGHFADKGDKMVRQAKNILTRLQKGMQE